MNDCLFSSRSVSSQVDQYSVAIV